jgi:uncharacterized protein (TIGR03083 family)
MSDHLEGIRHSSARLHTIVESLTPEQLRASAYPTEWNIGEALSHIGSGAEIMRLRIEATAATEDLADDYAQAIWDEWNAKTPDEQAADALVADRAFIESVAALSPEDTGRLSFTMGPMQLDLEGLLGLRLNEHALHTWDIEVAFDPAATVPAEPTESLIDNLEMIARFTGKPTGAAHEVHVRTVDPARDFTIEIGEQSVALGPCRDPECTPDLELPAEAFARLIYGRLDPAHTPATVHGTADLDELRRAFPGV